MPLFLPTVILPHLTDVTPGLLSELGVDFLMLDFDNTIVPYTTNEPTPEMCDWLRQMQASPIRLCVVSNSKKPRVVRFCERYGLDCVTRAKKPFHRGIRETLARFHLEPKQAALVGDQIYTDVLGANTAGLKSILISAIHNHNLLLKLRHVLELPWIGLGKLRLWLRSRKKSAN